MPEAAIDVDGNTGSREDDVGTASSPGQWRPVDEEAEPESVEFGSERALRLGVALPGALHAVPSLG